jgi:hypothetical protein
MSLKSAVQAFSRSFLGDGFSGQNYTDNNSDQSFGASQFDFANHFGLNPVSDPVPLAFNPPPFVPPSANAGSGDPGQLELRDDDGTLSAVQSNSGSGSVTSGTTHSGVSVAPAPTLVGAAGGLQFNLIWDTSVASAPAAFEKAAIYAASLYTSLYSNHEVINVHVGYGEVNGLSLGAGALGESMSYGYMENYSMLSPALQKDATSSSWQAQADATLPATDPTHGGRFFVSTAEAKALGQVSGTGTGIDGFVGLSSMYAFDYTPNTKPAANQYDAIGTFLHEFSEVMGRTGSLGYTDGTNVFTPLDLFRYSSSGTRDLTPGSGYFSVNNGVTNLGTYNNPRNGGDTADWIPSLVGDSYGSGYAGVQAALSPTDIIENSVLGYRMTPTAVSATTSPKLA